ncbi:pyruvate carboxylase [Purpureocillium lavendulum]|uniref:Pyruvate carboxylase n=1 Tax=Purpureocillium lavendulum TaxID=1247861 RepID=A0AB34G432_9HYPO|nr:pyruvate carboxylase [Purpureocillium lavendulum]
MASRKPSLHVVMPDRPQASTDFHGLQSGIRSPRSPRFREVFDAPFSEALMNASRTTLATDSTGSYPGFDHHSSFEGEAKRHASYSSMRTKAQAQSPSPLQSRQDSWTSSETTRRSSVNDRIREWARKSFVFSRKNSAQSDDGYFSHSQRPPCKSAVVTPTSEASTPYAFTSPDRYARPVVAVAEVDESR